MKPVYWALGMATGLSLALMLLPIRLPLMRIQQDVHNGSIVEAGRGQPATQTFASHYPGLAEIRFHLADPLPPDRQTITLRLSGVDGQERLALTTTVGEVREDYQLRFVFGPLDDTENQTYQLSLETTGDKPLRLLAHQGDMYPEGQAGGGGDLMFEARYNGPFWPTVRVLYTRLAQGKPALFGQVGWYVALSLAYLAALSGALLQLWRSGHR